jgi:hypothetical protein
VYVVYFRHDMKGWRELVFTIYIHMVLTIRIVYSIIISFMIEIIFEVEVPNVSVLQHFCLSRF